MLDPILKLLVEVTAKIRIFEKVRMNGDFAVGKGIVGDTTGTLVFKVVTAWPKHIHNSVWSVQLPFAEKLHVAMIKTAEWDVYGTRAIDRRWDILYLSGLSSQVELPIIERVVGFARGWNLLKRWVCTGDDCGPAEHCQRKQATEGTNDQNFDKNSQQ